KSDSNAAVELLNKVASYDAIVLGLHQYSRRPANNFDLSKASVQLAKDIQRYHNSISFVFGNPYAISNYIDAPSLLACYENDSITQHTAADILQGKLAAQGSLPVTVHERFHYGAGIDNSNALPIAAPESVGMSSAALNKINTIAQEAISKGATPGCVVLVARKGKVVYNKAFGYYNYDQAEPVQTGSVYDLASVTKISATTVSVMKLYEEGKLDLDKTIGDYLSWTKGSDKAPLKIRDILLHQAGLNPFIPFYRETIDTATGKRLESLYANNPKTGFTTRVAENVYLKNAWVDTMFQRILKSKLTPANKYVYSDNDFIFLGKIVEAISGKTLDVYASENFYQPLGMQTTTFKPREKMALGQIVPSEYEPHFRAQLIRGDVHDEGASMFGGVSGHAGLFSNAYDLAKLYQMLLNGGELNGTRYLKKETVDLFTAYNSNISRRGLGFDKPEKDNATRKEAYPSKSVSPSTYGHTGFTGTCVWVDPAEELVYIFLSNRVTPTRNNNKLGQLNVRPNIQEAIYQAIIKP
ncbi:MAG TPA: serine hydrolase, partial [Chitinophagaceae bacterium]|nr:serine hydrolase [Chitinophagaceae bacterium]